MNVPLKDQNDDTIQFFGLPFRVAQVFRIFSFAP